ncbi:hypothetical protein [Nocardia sp. NPDC005366]|uniref:hypothetical protein n=1 Tax=Nocardia sp. NPDC005366 TaxID=3156878 RepID=UPI0033B2F4E4
MSEGVRRQGTVGRVVAILLALIALSGCVPTFSDPESDGTPTPDYGSIRYDPEPLIEYFPLIGQPKSVAWRTWNNASGRVPGPTIYWIEAVVGLTEETAATLRSRFASAEQVQAPRVKGDLNSSVPGGSYLSGRELDTALGGSAKWGGGANGYLHRDQPTLVVLASTGG